MSYLIDCDCPTIRGVEPASVENEASPNSPLPEPWLRRIRRLYHRLGEFFDVSPQQFEMGFVRQSNRHGEIMLWERALALFDKVCLELPGVDRRRGFVTVLAYAKGDLAEIGQADPDLRQVIATIDAHRKCAPVFAS